MEKTASYLRGYLQGYMNKEAETPEEIASRAAMGAVGAGALPGRPSVERKQTAFEAYNPDNPDSEFYKQPGARGARYIGPFKWAPRDWPKDMPEEALLRLQARLDRFNKRYPVNKETPEVSEGAKYLPEPKHNGDDPTVGQVRRHSKALLSSQIGAPIPKDLTPLELKMAAGLARARN